jgi:hypothetical protein
MPGRWRLFPFIEVVGEKSPAVLVIMTIDAEVLPVGAVRWIVVRIPILVMHSEKVAFVGFEFTAAFGAN